MGTSTLSDMASCETRGRLCSVCVAPKGCDKPGLPWRLCDISVGASGNEQLHSRCVLAGTAAPKRTELDVLDMEQRCPAAVVEPLRDPWVTFLD